MKLKIKYRTPSVARPALEKFMLNLPKYAVFARTSAGLSIKVEADEAKKCLSQTELEGRSPRSTVRRVFFGAAGTRKQRRSIFRQPKPFLPTFFGEKK
jgi:hypothetical protein